jgi:site-specific recombinase XerD
MGRAKESWEQFMGRLRIDSGSTATFLDRFAEHLLESGYAIATAKNLLLLVASFGRWLSAKGLGMDAGGDDCLERFLVDRRQQGYAKHSAAANLRGFLAFLRAQGTIPPMAPGTPSPIDSVGQAYSRYLAQERGLSPCAVANYLPIVRRFLAWRFENGPLSFGELRTVDLHGFLTQDTRRYAPGRAKLTVTALRSFLKWLLVCGEIPSRLDQAIPGVPGWRLATLPKAIEPREVEHMLRSCRRRTIVERRDFAILLLLARLGLRAHEVVAMTLDDIEWDTPAIIVRGKGGRQDRLPLPHDAGDAIAAYLLTGRPQCSTRTLFIRSKAPLRGFANSSSISTIVRRALARAELHPPRTGAHALRHGLACSMLSHGATLPEIGEVLRHRSLDTTGIYAKVHLEALAPLAQEWPLAGGGE